MSMRVDAELTDGSMVVINVDSLYITELDSMSHEDGIASTVEISHGLNIDCDKGGKAIGIEVYHWPYEWEVTDAKD
jgi:hypothetical protein